MKLIPQITANFDSKSVLLNNKVCRFCLYLPGPKLSVTLCLSVPTDPIRSYQELL